MVAKEQLAFIKCKYDGIWDELRTRIQFSLKESRASLFWDIIRES